MKAMSLELALLILDQIDSVSMTDEYGRYIYKNKNWHSRRINNNQDVNSKYPWDIIKDSKVKHVLECRQPYIGHIISLNDENRACCNYYPVFDNGKFIGVLIWTFFTGLDKAIKFSQQISDLKKDLEVAKMQIKKLSTANYSIANIIGESQAIIKLKSEIATAARTKSTVIIEGETGVGKELVAHAIHDLSLRSSSRFVRVNCAAIPLELMESEFFGYEEGAFTSARKGGKVGKFELASSGSLFLDEINQLPLTLQPKFLRVLQEQEIERIGGKTPISIDTRIIAATNTLLSEMVQAKTFREDLYYRLNVIKIRIPPLRERKEDIPLLAHTLLLRLNHQLDMNVSNIEPDVLNMFTTYEWPGNIRELQNILESAMSKVEEDSLELRHFGQLSAHFPAVNVPPAKNALMKRVKETAEKDILLEALQLTNGNRLAAAKHLGLARSSLYRKLKKYGL